MKEADYDVSGLCGLRCIKNRTEKPLSVTKTVQTNKKMSERGREEPWWLKKHVLIVYF